jgi:SAM-dependent methyltransferase
MSYLLFPGRHLVNTRFQAEYLARILSCDASDMPGLIPGTEVPKSKIEQFIFAITSSNQANSRYNPIPFHTRAVSVDRFARELDAGALHRIFGIPHYGHIESFAGFTVKEIRDQSEGLIRLDPANCFVLCSTPEVIGLYQALGFSILTAEQTSPGAPVPIDLIRALADAGDAWPQSEFLNERLAPSSFSLLRDFPEIPRRIIRLYHDPLTNQEGSLTESRNYNSYARGMNEIMRLKYLDIADAIRAGRIVDEGCSDGGLLAEISRGFPDSDLYGIDLSAEFAHRFEERRRAGDFGGSYAHFFLRNLLDPLFDPESIDTTLCNSTLHELWSYAEGETTVRAYLREKFRQLRPGGRLIIRDVVGPDDADRDVLLWCNPSDGKELTWEAALEVEDRTQAFLESLSTLGRFHIFLVDFLGNRPRREVLVPSHPSIADSPDTYRVSFRLAAEFLSKKDYTDNWSSEMNEEFCFWSFTQWKNALRDTGFEIVEQEVSGKHLSRSYCNPWIIEHRFNEKVRVTSLDGVPQDFPPTNMVLVAEKPQSHQANQNALT